LTEQGDMMQKCRDDSYVGWQSNRFGMAQDSKHKSRWSIKCGRAYRTLLVSPTKSATKIQFQAPDVDVGVDATRTSLPPKVGI
jgi:hypothetical protein